MKTIILVSVLLFLNGCDSKPENEQPDESKLKLEQIAEQFNAKIASKDIEEFGYTVDFQNYFSDPKQHFVFELWADDLLKQNNTIMGRFISGSDAVLFLKINQGMLQTIKAEERWKTFIDTSSQQENNSINALKLSTFHSMFSASSFHDFIRRLRYMSMVVQQDYRVFKHYETNRDLLESYRATLKRSIPELEKLLRDIQDKEKEFVYSVSGLF